MKRSGPLRSDPEKAAAWRRRSKKLKPVSDKRREGSPARRAVVAKAMDAVGGQCSLSVAKFGPLRHRCGGGATPHHILKASQGGGYDQSNIVILCAVANGLVEDYPTDAWLVGLVCRAGDTLDDCYERMLRAGMRPPSVG